MPVFVTRTDSDVGHALVQALVADGADVRGQATDAGNVDVLRAAGAVIAMCDADDEGHLEAAMTDAHTVVVPHVSWFDDADERAAVGQATVAAAVGAQVTRIVVVSLVGADPTSSDPLLAACGVGDQLAATSAIQSLVVHTDGPAAEADDVLAALDGCPDTIVAPVAVDDLVAGLVALDRARSTTPAGHADFTALGAHHSPADTPAEDQASGGLVGRRWLPPAQRDRLRAALCDRGAPQVRGANLWDFVATQEQAPS